MTNVLAYSDGTRDLVDLAERIGISADEAIETSHKLAQAGLLTVVDG
jgi:aminopeptidase-like protein